MTSKTVASAKEKPDSDSKIKNEKEKAVKDRTAIWSAHEIPSEETGDILVPDVSSDPRLTPNYDIYFQQHVTTEDVFLQVYISLILNIVNLILQNPYLNTVSNSSYYIIVFIHI